MPNDGVPAKIELLPEFAAGLGDIESNSHLIILGWFHQAHRHRLTVTGKSGRPGREQRGVFGLRSSTRPNPVALNIARLVHRDGTVLSLERLDMIDGTPVVDIKRYSPGWDDVFAARTSRQLRPLPAPDAELVEILLNEVEHFHGAIDAGARRAVRLVADTCSRWRIHPTDPALTVTIPMRQGAAVDGSVADSVQALTRATFGSAFFHHRGHGRHRGGLHQLDLAAVARFQDEFLDVGDDARRIPVHLADGHLAAFGQRHAGGGNQRRHHDDHYDPISHS